MKLFQLSVLLGLFILASCSEDVDAWQVKLDMLYKERDKIRSEASAYPCHDIGDWGIYAHDECTFIPYYKPLVNVTDLERQYKEIQSRISQHYRKRNIIVDFAICRQGWSTSNPVKVVCLDGEATVVRGI